MGFGAEFDSPRMKGICRRGAQPAEMPSAAHLFWAEALRGESAYLLRKYAPASARLPPPSPARYKRFAFA